MNIKLRYLCVALTLILFSGAALIHLSADSIPPGDRTLRRVRVPVLMYHYISIPPANADRFRLDLSVTPSNFRAQMQWLKNNGYTTITPDDLAAALIRGQKLPSRPVLLTFDDGYEDAYTNVFPILKEFGFRGTFFVVSGFITEGRSGYVTWNQAKEMVAAGMAIQNHSRRHYDMRERSREWLLQEIQSAQESIEINTGIQPRFFCYPSGRYDSETIQALRAIGIVAAFTTSDGIDEYTDDMFRLPRVRIRGTTSIEQFGHLIARHRDAIVR